MTQIEDYLDRSPQETKRLVGIDFEQLQELVKQGESLRTRKQQERPRLIQAGGGRSRSLSVKQEILLTLVYLNQYITFQMLGIQFGVSESTANDIFHEWVENLSELLPPSSSQNRNNPIHSPLAQPTLHGSCVTGLLRCAEYEAAVFMSKYMKQQLFKIELKSTKCYMMPFISISIK